MKVIKNVGKQTFLVLRMWKEHGHSVNGTQERLEPRINTSRMTGKLEKLTSLGHGLGALLRFQAEVRLTDNGIEGRFIYTGLWGRGEQSEGR